MKIPISRAVFAAITPVYILLSSCTLFQKDSEPPEGFEYGKPFRAIDNYCAWPNLTLLQDGSIIATVFNKPSHGGVPGDVECWGSIDGGWTWKYRGTPARGGENGNRMNVAAGLARNGDLLVLASGYKDPGEFTNHMPVLVCRSSDGGYTWEIEKGPFPADSSGNEIVPFGDIIMSADSGLIATAYRNKAHAVKSNDDGHTWSILSNISSSVNEVAPLHLGKGDWLAAGRTRDSYPSELVELFISDDDGKSWEFRQHISEPGQHPGHLMRASDGRILFSCGDRYAGRKGVMGRISEDNGKSWGESFRILDMEVDGSEIGYPSSVQNSAGKIVTAFYSDMDGYHMGVVVWDLPMSLTRESPDIVVSEFVLSSDKTGLKLHFINLMAN